MHVAEAHLQRPLSSPQTPHPVVAVEDDGLVALEGLQQGDGLVVQEPRPLDVRLGPLLRGTDVEELEGLALLHPGLELGGLERAYLRGLVRVVDLEAATLGPFHEVDGHAVHLPGSRALHQDHPAVAFDLHVARTGVVEVHPVLPAGRHLEPDGHRALALVELDELLERLVGEEDLRVLHLRALDPQHLLELAALVHLQDDVAAADELAVHVELGDGRPAGVLLHALPNGRIGEHVEGLVLGEIVVEHVHHPRAEAALGGPAMPLHEEHHGVAFDHGVDAALHGFVRHGTEVESAAPTAQAPAAAGLLWFPRW